MKIRYKSAALRDIQQKQDYIGTVLKNKPAAQKLTRSILRAVSSLADNPRMGVPLSGKFDVDSDFRFLTVSKQLIFYRVEEEQISVARVLDGRQDYMSILFG